MAKKPLVVVGMIGPVLDAGKGPQRWERWRPTVALCMHEDLVINRFELLYQQQFEQLATQLAADIKQASPETEVRPHQVEMADAWDFEQVYGALHDFARSANFHPEREDYLVHITTGTHVRRSACSC
jgi:transcriptional regulatory protein RtcR